MGCLLADARAGLFDILCAEGLDRISRDQEGMAHMHTLPRFNRFPAFVRGKTPGAIAQMLNRKAALPPRMPKLPSSCRTSASIIATTPAPDTRETVQRMPIGDAVMAMDERLLSGRAIYPANVRFVRSNQPIIVIFAVSRTRPGPRRIRHQAAG